LIKLCDALLRLRGLSCQNIDDSLYIVALFAIFFSVKHSTIHVLVPHLHVSAMALLSFIIYNLSK